MPDRILVLDDEVSISSLLVDIFIDEGWLAVPFRSNRDAIRFLDVERPAFAVLDFNVADGNSSRTAQCLRRLAIPFIVLSGYPQALTRTPDFAGVPWIEKPFGIASFLDAVRDLMRA